MTPLHPIMLFGFAALAVPLIIHLLNRSRYRVMKFGGMMFLRQAQHERAQTIKLQQILLLLVRCLFIAFLVWAMCRPFTPGEEGSGSGQPTTHVLVFDGSFSMQQGEDEDRPFERAKKHALRVVDEQMKKGDNALLVWAGEKPRSIVDTLIYDKKLLTETIEELEPGKEQANMPRALEHAFFALEESPLPRHRVYVLTDSQEVGWEHGDEPLWKKLKEFRDILKVEPAIYTLEHKPEDIVNLSPVRVYPRSPIVDIYRETKFTAEIQNDSKEKKNVTVLFYVDGKVEHERDLELKPGITSTDFDYLFTESGSHYTEVAIEGEDDLPVDNRSVLSVHVVEKIPVLMVEGKTSDDFDESDGEIMARALEVPGRPGEESLFKVATVNQLELNSMNLAKLLEYRAVIFSNVSSFSQDFIYVMEQYVEQGGGVFFCLGAQTRPSEYRKFWKEDGTGLLPADLVEIAEREGEDAYFHPKFPAGAASFMLDIFDLTKTRILTEVRVDRYWKCQPAEENVRVLAQFDDDPFLYKRFGKGHVVQWTTTGSAKWNNFPFTQDFLPLLHNVAVFVASKTAPPNHVNQGEPIIYSTHRPTSGSAGEGEVLEEFSAQEEPPEEATLVRPDGEEEALELVAREGEWTAESNETWEPGLYTVKVEGLPDRYFSVPFPPDEAGLGELDEELSDELAEVIPFERHDDYQKLLESIGEEKGGREWWLLFVSLAFGALCFELFLSWKFSNG